MSLTEQACETGLARSVVATHLNALEASGWVERLRPTIAAARANGEKTLYRLAVPRDFRAHQRRTAAGRLVSIAGSPVDNSPNRPSPGDGLVRLPDYPSPGDGLAVVREPDGPSPGDGHVVDLIDLVEPTPDLGGSAAQPSHKTEEEDFSMYTPVEHDEEHDEEYGADLTEDAAATPPFGRPDWTTEQCSRAAEMAVSKGLCDHGEAQDLLAALADDRETQTPFRLTSYGGCSHARALLAGRRDAQAADATLAGRITELRAQLHHDPLGERALADARTALHNPSEVQLLAEAVRSLADPQWRADQERREPTRIGDIPVTQEPPRRDQVGAGADSVRAPCGSST